MRQKNRERGTVLIIAMVVVVMLTLFSMSLITLSVQNLKNETAQEKHDASMLLAQSGVGAGVAYMALKTAPVLAVDEETAYIEERFPNLAATGWEAPESGENKDPGYKYKIKYKGNYLYQITSQSIANPVREIQTVYEIMPPNLEGLAAAFSLNVPKNADIDNGSHAGVNLNFGGVNAVIDGRDHALDGAVDATLPALAGVAKNETETFVGFDTSAAAAGQLLGSPQTKDNGPDLSKNIDAIAEAARNYHTWSYTLTSNNVNLGNGDAGDDGHTVSYGDPSNYVVGYIKATGPDQCLKLVNDGSIGYGIIVIESTLTTISRLQVSYSGQFKWKGLIIMKVNGDYDAGNQTAVSSTGGGAVDSHILGAMLVDIKGSLINFSENQAGALKVTGSDGSGVMYSSAAVKNALDALSGKSIRFKFLKNMQ